MSRQENFENRSPDKKFKTGKELKDEVPELAEVLGSSRLARKVVNASFRILLYSYMLVTPQGREALKIPEARRTLYDREARVGLLEDSIISDKLHVPNKERTSLELKSTVAGRFVSYDFHRPEEFKSAAKKRDIQNGSGRLVVFALDEIKDNDKNDYTPTDLFNYFDILHIMSFDSYSPEDAIKEGYLKETTYRNAYKKVGLYNDRNAMFLELQGLSDQPIYAVTPKGNTVVALLTDGGKKSEQPKKVGELSRVFSFPSI